MSLQLTPKLNDKGQCTEIHVSKREDPVRVIDIVRAINPLSPDAKFAYETILNLRKLTKETGTISTRAQNDVLRALNSTDLASVANALARETATAQPEPAQPAQ